MNGEGKLFLNWYLVPDTSQFKIKTIQDQQQIDYLIIGQGLAGTLMSWNLIMAGQRVLVIDQEREFVASKVAAGIINPITGRRYVKSWMVDQLLPTAREVYQNIENTLGISIYHPRSILRCLFNNREENDWLIRSGAEGYSKYMLDEAELGPYAQKTELAFSYGEVQHAAQVDLPQLIQQFRSFLAVENSLLTASFEWKALEIGVDSIRYKNINADRIIFCEGSRAVNNPYFSYLPFKLAKGEVLIVHMPKAGFEKLLKHRVFIVPLGKDLYWIGASYEWQFEDEQPTPEGKSFLVERLEDILKIPFEIVTHTAALRPTVKDRRPFIGVHPAFSRLFIFNGLGTKGASLGPYWARRFTEHLMENRPLEDSVDIKRFLKDYENLKKFPS